MKWYVIEVNTKQNGEVSPGVYIRDSEEQAMKLWHSKCAANIDNASYTNSLIQVVRSDGYVCACQVYTHEAVGG